jgi:hypothetical protein
MAAMDKNLKQVYDATLAMISKLHFKLDAFSQEEMYFLLSLLDIVVQGNTDKEFLHCLRAWQEGERNDEIDEIIKASLLPLDFNDSAAVKQNLMLISDLLAYRNDGDAD